MKQTNNTKKLQNNKNKKGKLKIFSAGTAMKTCIVFGIVSFMAFLGTAISDSIILSRASQAKEDIAKQYSVDVELLEDVEKGFLGTFIGGATGVAVSGIGAGFFSFKDKSKGKDDKDKEKEKANPEIAR